MVEFIKVKQQELPSMVYNVIFSNLSKRYIMIIRFSKIMGNIQEKLLYYHICSYTIHSEEQKHFNPEVWIITYKDILKKDDIFLKWIQTINNGKETEMVICEMDHNLFHTHEIIKFFKTNVNCNVSIILIQNSLDLILWKLVMDIQSSKTKKHDENTKNIKYFENKIINNEINSNFISKMENNHNDGIIKLEQYQFKSIKKIKIEKIE